MKIYRVCFGNFYLNDDEWKISSMNVKVSFDDFDVNSTKTETRPNSSKETERERESHLEILLEIIEGLND